MTILKTIIPIIIAATMSFYAGVYSSKLACEQENGDYDDDRVTTLINVKSYNNKKNTSLTFSIISNQQDAAKILKNEDKLKEVIIFAWQDIKNDSLAQAIMEIRETLQESIKYSFQTDAPIHVNLTEALSE